MLNPENVNIQSMIVFYTPEELGSGRMGSEYASILAYDGESTFVSNDSNIPKTFDEIQNFIKNNKFKVKKRANSLPLIDVLIRTRKDIRNIYEYKYGDVALLGMGNIGYSLGVIELIVEDGEHSW